MIRQAYYELESSKGKIDKAHYGRRTPAPYPHDHSSPHIDHCFDYIRQAIICAADPAIEPARIGKDGLRSQVDGWGAEHQCRSWEDLIDFANENAPSEAEWWGD